MPAATDTYPFPIVEMIAQNLIETLAGVSESASFHVTLRPERAKIPASEPADLKAVLGQDDPADPTEDNVAKTWDQPWQILIYVINSETSTLERDQRINLVWGDVCKKLMEDRTRGGLALDTKIAAPQYFADSILINIVTPYETKFDDPFSQPYSKP
jgi:hypothetical protein